MRDPISRFSSVKIPDSPKAIRDGLRSCARDLAEARLALWRTGQGRFVAAIRPHAWLANHEAVQAVLRFHTEGQCSAAEAGALGAHLHRVRLELALAGARDAQQVAPGMLAAAKAFAAGQDGLTPLADLEEGAIAASGPLLTVRRRAETALAGRLEGRRDRTDEDQSGGNQLPSDPDGPGVSLTGLAEEVLQDTQGLLDAALHRLELHRPAGPGVAPAWMDLLRALRIHEPSRDRASAGGYLRWAEALAPLGFARELDNHVRLEPRGSDLLPQGEVVAQRIPHEVRIGVAQVDYGLISVTAQGYALGQAIGLACTSVGLPAEHAHRTTGTAARAFGALLASLWMDRSFVDRWLPTSDATARRIAATAGLSNLLTLRLHAAAVCAQAAASAAGDEEDARRALAVDGLRRAFGLPPPAGLAVLLLATPFDPQTALRSHLGALSLRYGLRETFDEDWVRNPRCADPLHAAQAQGGLLSVEAWCADLAVEPTHGLAWLEEAWEPEDLSPV